MWVYTIAKHFSISIKEVHEMSPKQFEQSLVWTMIGQEENEKQRKKSKSSSNNNNQESVSIDYNWALDKEDF